MIKAIVIAGMIASLLMATHAWKNKAWRYVAFFALEFGVALYLLLADKVY